MSDGNVIQSTSPERSSWNHMKSRCQNSTHERYKDFGGRGIFVCERWQVFAHFLADMGSRPNGTTLGRFDKAKGYDPSNCKWMTPQELRQGKRPPTSWHRKIPDTHCSKGHELPEKDEKGRRRCLVCVRENTKQYAERARERGLNIKKEVIQAYGGHCVCCGETHIEFLALDHIHNDGAERRRIGEHKTGGTFYRKLKKEGFPKGIVQILCHNCNGAKGYYGYCPHAVEAQTLLGLEVVKVPVIRVPLTPKQKDKVIIKRRPFRMRKLDDEREMLLVNKYLAGGITMAKLARDFNVSVGIAYKTIHKHTDCVVDAPGAVV